MDRRGRKRITLTTFLLSLIFAFSIFHSSSALVQCRKGESQESCKARLLEELKEKEEEVKKLQQGIQKENAKQNALYQEIRRINAKIRETSLAIKRKERLISRLRSEISSKEEKIRELNEKLKREKESLARILRRKHELGDTTILEFLLSSKSLSDFYHDASLFSYIQKSLSSSFKEIDALKREIFEEKQKLEEKKEEHANEKYQLALEKGKVEVEKKDRDIALRVSQSKEATLAQLKKKREEEIKKIRAMLIQFHGNGVSRKISFGEAYDYAKFAYRKTGVDPAFLIAIMQQETNLGGNVGGCYVTDLETGDGVGKNSGLSYEKVMGRASLPYFKYLTEKLGRDWRKTPVSCPIDVGHRGSARKYYVGRGYGGAMGYTQFIPSTWKRVEGRVREILGAPYGVADPWNPQHAMVATALYIRDLGAHGKLSKSTYSSYVRAACRYYGVCGFYNNSVMNKALKIQKLIDTLERD